MWCEGRGRMPPIWQSGFSLKLETPPPSKVKILKYAGGISSIVGRLLNSRLWLSERLNGHQHRGIKSIVSYPLLVKTNLLSSKHVFFMSLFCLYPRTTHPLRPQTTIIKPNSYSTSSTVTPHTVFPLSLTLILSSEALLSIVYSAYIRLLDGKLFVHFLLQGPDFDRAQTTPIHGHYVRWAIFLKRGSEVWGWRLVAGCCRW